MGKGMEIYERIMTSGRGAQYFLSRWDRARMLVEALRQAIFPRKILVAGPYVGEFGNELRFHGFARATARRYAEKYVITYPGRELLYPGFRLIAHDIPLEKAGYGHGRLNPREHRELAKALLPKLKRGQYDLFTANVYKAWLLGRPIWRPEYRVLSSEFKEANRTDLLLHFRAIKKEGWDKRPNFEGDHADRLWAACNALGLRTACIGHPIYSYCPPGCVDYRSEDLRQTVSKICATKLLVGQQSGGAHLVNYCGKPTLIWAASREIIETGLGRNPHRVPIIVVADDTWLPPVEKIVAKLKSFLNGSLQAPSR